MKNIKQLTLVALFGVLYFAQVAGAVIEKEDTTRESTRVAISPYAQAVPNDSYTFIGISHPSLDTALTQIGLVLEAVGFGTSAGTQSSRSVVFTIDAGETHRIFIVNASHSSINDQNSSFTDSRTHLITTSNSAQFGAVRLTTVTKFPTTSTVVGTKDKFANLAQLSMWGIVFVEASSVGFAMEFIGDMADSTIGGNIGNMTPTSNIADGKGGGCATANPNSCASSHGAALPGRGIN